MMNTINVNAAHKQAMTLQRSAVRAVARPRAAVARVLAATATQEAPAGNRAAKVAFQVEKHVEYGEEVCLVGGKDLGEWDAQAAVCLSWHDGDVWSAECELPAGSHLEYKYIIRRPSGEVVQWQPIPTNLELDVPEAASLTVVDAWDAPARCGLNAAAANNGSGSAAGAATAELPAPEALAVASADDAADEDVVLAYLADDQYEDEWDGGASGGAANGVLEATAVPGVVRRGARGARGGGGGGGKHGVVVAAAAALALVKDDEEGPQGGAPQKKMPRTLSAVKRELKAAGLPATGKKNDLVERLRQALSGSA